MDNYFKDNQEMMIQLLEQLVNIDSGSHNKAGIDKIGQVLAKAYREIDFNVDVIKEEVYGNHLVLKHKDATDPKLIIVAHMDTVFEKGTVEKRPFTIKGDRAYGPGVIDMKASLVTLLYSIKSLIKSGSSAQKNVLIILNSDEEIGSKSSRSLIEAHAQDKSYALVMEPARKNGALVTGRRGSYRFKISVTGEAAHSGIEPEKGASAIEDLAEKVVKLHGLSDHSAGISVNVGLIEGGHSINMIAPEATAKMDVRIKNMKQAITIKKEIESICGQSDVPGTSVKLEGGMSRPPMIKNKAVHKLFETIQTEGENIGLDLIDTATGGGSDASFIATLGIPTIDGMGPVGGHAHSENEYLEIPSLIERAHLLARSIQKLSK